MSASGDIPNGTEVQEFDEFSTLSADLEQLDGALSRLEENSNAFNANAMSVLLEIKQIREENSNQEQQEASAAEKADSK